MERSNKTDLTTEDHVARFFIDGGIFGPSGRVRLDETGTELGDIMDRIYRIRGDDPLSARATMDQESVIKRGDWEVRIKTAAKMSATRDAFFLDATVDCWDGEEPFHSVEWHHEIPRNGT